MRALQTKRRRGLTLVELLVVVVILVILVAVVLPLARPALRGREVREAARQLNAYLGRVQAESIAKNRSYGVALIRSDSDRTKCFQLQQVSYRSGSFTGLHNDSRVSRSGSRLIFKRDNGNNGGEGDDDIDTTTLLDRLIEPNQVIYIKLNFRGDWIQVKRSNQDIPTTAGPANVTLDFVDDRGERSIDYIPTGFLNGLGNFATYQIQLPPRTSTAAPLELPQGAYIDITSSDYFDYGKDVVRPFYPNNKFPIMLMFNTEGSLTELRQVFEVNRTPGTVLLSVVSEDPEAKSYWVSINARTNRIATVENLGSRESALSGISASGK